MACEVRLGISYSPYATVLHFRFSLFPSVCRLYAEVRYSILTSYRNTIRIYLFKNVSLEFGLIKH